MPSLDVHLEYVRRNQAALDLLLPSVKDHPAWVVTVAFYKAVHVVEGAFARLGNWHSADHGDRGTRLAADRRFAQIRKYFHRLRDVAYVGRYGSDDPAFKTFTDFMPSDDVVNQVVGYWLREVEKSAVKLTGLKFE